MRFWCIRLQRRKQHLQLLLMSGCTSVAAKAQSNQRLGISVLEGEESTVSQKHNPTQDTLAAMCPPCVIWTTYSIRLWCACFMSFRKCLYGPVPLQVCDGFICASDSQLCEASSSHLFRSHPLVSYFCWLQTLEPDVDMIFFFFSFLLLLFWSVERCWCVVLLWSQRSTPTPLHLCCQFFECEVSSTLCFLCGPRVQQNPAQHRHVDLSRFLRLWMFQFELYKLFFTSQMSFALECISSHLSIRMHVAARSRSGSTLSLLPSLINFNSFCLLFSD